eukprot:Em0022g114a
MAAIEEQSDASVNQASLHRWGQKEPLEIRRFFVEQDVSTSYSNLLKKVVEMFRCVDPDKLDIAWTDKEGDRIVISSDTELAEATTQLDSNILRLTITDRRGKPEEEGEVPEELQIIEEEEIIELEGELLQTPKGKVQLPTQHSICDRCTKGPQLHRGVTCDGCDGPIYGTRFKCLVCPDYDLCSTCESKSGHLEHNMIAYTSPYERGPGSWYYRPPWCPWFKGQESVWMRGRPFDIEDRENPLRSICEGSSGQNGRADNARGKQGHGHECADAGGRSGGGGGGRGGRKHGRHGKGGRGGEKKSADVGLKQTSGSELGVEEKTAAVLFAVQPSEGAPNPRVEPLINLSEAVGSKNAQDEVMQQALDEFLQEVQSEKPDASTDSALSMESEEMQKALTELEGLGYENTGGWLSQLVKVKKGNIDEVLRALNPMRPPESQEPQTV